MCKSSETSYATMMSFPSFRRSTASSGNVDGIFEIKSISGGVLGLIIGVQQTIGLDNGRYVNAVKVSKVSTKSDLI